MSNAEKSPSFTPTPITPGNITLTLIENKDSNNNTNAHSPIDYEEKFIIPTKYKMFKDDKLCIPNWSTRKK